jgi:hypothetical protein
MSAVNGFFDSNGHSADFVGALCAAKLSATFAKIQDSRFPSHSHSHIATDGQSISKSWCRAPSGDHDQIFITLWQSRSCFFTGTSSRQRGRFCLLYMLLVLASAVFLGSQSFGSRDHILPSQFWDYDSQGHGGGFDPATTRVSISVR